ncbi:MAG TPA: glycosyltransferase, partial [Solirubrobacteraceae bacterium]|nr:glycosyltransferase [Solirubrobacteraceae bacterium]
GGRAVAGFRDIIDEPGFVRDLWSRTGVYETLRDHYEAICVYGSREVTDFGADLGLDGELAERVSYTGYLAGVVQPRPGFSRQKPEILACTGGGADGGKLLEMFILAMRDREATAEGSPGSAQVVGGPLLDEQELGRLRSLAGESSVNVSRFILDLDQRIADDDLVVTMPGYNTTCELLSGHARAIVVPRHGPSQEQRMRAAWLTDWERADVIDPLDLTPELLAATIHEVMLKPPPPPPPVPLDGLARMGALLEAMATGQDVPVTQ